LIIIFKQREDHINKRNFRNSLNNVNRKGKTNDIKSISKFVVKRNGGNFLFAIRTYLKKYVIFPKVLLTKLNKLLGAI